ncbi:MAG: hypothetical protein KJ915_04160 [Candidatus Omnitrophica bacterium]|nr:hypothetical protein [Candidatus Omnitrophota bacterium]
MRGFKSKRINCRILVGAVIVGLVMPPITGFAGKENTAKNAMLSPSLSLGADTFQYFFIDSRAAPQASNALRNDPAFAEYQSLVRVNDSSIEVKQSQGVSAYFLEQVFKRVLVQLNKRKVWSDFPSFYAKNEFVFGFKAGQKELYIINQDTKIISLPASLLNNFSALLFTLRHVIQQYNNPQISQDKVLISDAFFFMNCFDYERSEILQWPELALYENRKLLRELQQAIAENNFSQLNKLLFNKSLTKQTNRELKKVFSSLCHDLKDVSISQGRLQSFVLLLWEISNANKKQAKKTFYNLIYGLSSIPAWSKLVKEASPGVFITKLDQLLAESYFGMHHTNSQVKALLSNTVLETLFYFKQIENRAEQFRDGGKESEFRQKRAAHVRGILGEISGLHKYTFVFKDTVMLLDKHPQIDSRNKIYVSRLNTGEDFEKECDAHTAGTMLEFKYSAHYRDIYAQLFGFMKQGSVFSLLLNAHQKKALSLQSRDNPKLNSSDRELTNVKNVVYFAENDINGFAQHVSGFVQANKDSFDPKTGRSLEARTLWNADGFNCRLNLKEFEILVLDPDFIQGLLSETQVLQGMSEEFKTKYFENLRNYSEAVFSEMIKIYQKTGFDIYISISNPKLRTLDKSFVSGIKLADDIKSSRKNIHQFSADHSRIEHLFFTETAI